MSATRFTIIVPDVLAPEVREFALSLRGTAHQANLSGVYIEVTTDQPEIEDEFAIARVKAATATTPRSRPARRTASAAAAAPAVPAPAPAPRIPNAVVYQAVAGKSHEEAPPTPRRVMLFLIRHPQSSARQVMEWIARQDESTVESVQKSVESSIHLLRTRGLIESLEARR